ncbi:unnamed protein product [Mytilus coruscus]|uniref:Uncharacterized protein n=1 Tax=Mytilus coruscus TaxID=42192 RepID=A0A6J8CQE1_MYTCO|nr:unnamed protein product [Mytilus coruscus]
MTSQDIVEIELEEEKVDNYTCKLCNENRAIKGEANNTQTVQTSRPTDGHYEQLALPTCSNNALTILADAGAVREEEVYEAETCGICENTIEDTANSLCSDGQTIYFPCIDTIKRTSITQVNNNIDEHQTYVKLGETLKEQQTNITVKPQSEPTNHQQANPKATSNPADVHIDAPAAKAPKSKQDQTDT